MERNCNSCYYSQPALNEELVVCSYMNDILSNGDILDSKEEWRNARYFARLSNFSGDAFEAYAKEGEETVLKVCVDKSSICGKWAQKRTTDV